MFEDAVEDINSSLVRQTGTLAEVALSHGRSVLTRLLDLACSRANGQD